jgi:hypothetical protein
MINSLKKNACEIQFTYACQVDFFTETKLLWNVTDEAKKASINQKMDIMLKEIKEIEHLNLKHLNENQASR